MQVAIPLSTAYLLNNCGSHPSDDIRQRLRMDGVKVVVASGVDHHVAAALSEILPSPSSAIAAVMADESFLIRDDFPIVMVQLLEHRVLHDVVRKCWAAYLYRCKFADLFALSVRVSHSPTSLTDLRKRIALNNLQP